MLLLVALSCQPKLDPETTAIPSRPLEFRIDEAVEGLEMRLSEATPPQAPRADDEEGADQEQESPVETLEIEEIEALLARTDPLEGKEGDRREFNKRADTLPPPRTGATELQSWPPPPTEALPPEVVDGPLEVIRYSPEGEVGLAPYMSVTFNKAVIAITTQDEAAEQIPVSLHPEPEGQWRWLGTRTVVFEPDPRFPMATDYAVTVPETGTSFSFSTPPVQVTE